MAIGDLMKTTRLKRSIFFLISDLALLAAAITLAFFIRFEGVLPGAYAQNFHLYLIFIWIAKVPIFYLFGLYRMHWRYVSMRELLNIFSAVTTSSLLLGTLLFLVDTQPLLGTVPRSIPVLDFFLTLFLIGGFRASKRVVRGLAAGGAGAGKRVLIAGAGDAGEQIVSGMQKEVRSNYSPVGFVDDDSAKIGTLIHGVAVLGSTDEIPQVVKHHAIDELIIAMPSAASTTIRRIVEQGRLSNVQEIKILPGFHELITGQVGLSDIRDVQLEDLLGREPVDINASEIGEYLTAKTVLVTGAAGSIGSELCRQIVRFEPERLIALDQDETGLFHVENDLKDLGIEFFHEAIIGDICDEQKIEELFDRTKPQVVFHAAAYKHVPLMEANPDEAIKNNILGTLVVAQAAMRHKCERFVLISTDKAVNPTSIMGTTKRIAEMIIQSLNCQGDTRFMAVRFGNVLGSRGSVIPEFQRQIKKGGPVTVTHEEIERYFMITSEAVLLVLQAGAMGEGGEVFVLDMGNPVKILELARELIRLSGYEPDTEIPIIFTGLRPGEKLFEELLTAEEGTLSTKHEKIFIARLSDEQGDGKGHKIEEQVKELLRKVPSLDTEGIKPLLKEIVPTYELSGHEQA